MYAVQNDTELKFNRVLHIQVIFLWTGWIYNAYNREAGTIDDLCGTREQNRGLGGVSKKIITRTLL